MLVLPASICLAAAKAGPFQEFYYALVAKGIKSEMARLTLTRKIAAITLVVWKKGERFDAKDLKPPDSADSSTSMELAI